MFRISMFRTYEFLNFDARDSESYFPGIRVVACFECLVSEFMFAIIYFETPISESRMPLFSYMIKYLFKLHV